MLLLTDCIAATNIHGDMSHIVTLVLWKYGIGSVITQRHGFQGENGAVECDRKTTVGLFAPVAFQLEFRSLSCPCYVHTSETPNSYTNTMQGDPQEQHG